ncbi:prephenate dehydrogenase [Campylobacter sputorum subsp. bubulus]|uniref:Prephenate dehydrogenase n=1 Tax=Campylobacter sputorum subsp. sputorum TaxID=32024 RepID=A0A381DI34_9BACT|nr:chemotaxis protein CheX [Campylobacter sputorum]ASM35350.1 chemotaxis phosphatase CheX [Campylobacter sputorum aubsp. sputorum RM3237]KAB0582906.1 chemotaxis protein CheX [Campylobacter sputorum subsp. sputorum]QEL05542.1 chemotaxis phosphatase CheX [Campylobacter sputorum subsp. sputorum]SUX08639.1 prephenate dehydrogenase [Campylobacter sputorum subsp. bubulus]SUX10305.1 prephenate dehydrogenase [Campylobacter sputorum subsp. sputorum]
MTPVLKNSVAIFSPIGFVDGAMSKTIIDSNDMLYLKEKMPVCVFISFKKVIFFNKIGFNNIINTLQNIKEELKISIGLCDYNEKMFKSFFDMSDQSINYSLFETLEVGMLFYDKSNENKKKVLIYTDSQKQNAKIALSLAQKGHDAYIAKNSDDFKNMQKDFDYILSMTHIMNYEKNTQIYIKDNVVVYNLNGYLDSSFAENFDKKYYENLIKVGFKYFIFDGTNISSFNVYGTAFLASLSVLSAEYGVVIAICNIKNITQALKNELEDGGILVYDSMDDFYNDERTISGGAGMLSNKINNIGKNLIETLPNIISIISSSISSILKTQITKKQASLTPFSSKGFEDYIGAYIAFYGDIDGKLLLCTSEDCAKEICKVLLDENQNERNDIAVALAEFMDIIGENILLMFNEKKQKVEITMSRSITNIKEFEANKSKGAFLELDINGKSCIIFLSK